MSRVGTLRVLIRQRLSAAAEEIFELFERTLSEYEEEVRTQRTLLDAVFKPEVRLHREGGRRGGCFVCELLVCRHQSARDLLAESPRVQQLFDVQGPHL